MCDSAQRSIAVGFFDGVHLGHQAVLRAADVAVTFKNHPLSVIAPEKAPKLIMSADERLEAIRSFGVKEVLAIDFTPDFAKCPCEEFAHRYFGSPGSARIFSGGDWRFGKGAQGDADWLLSHGWKVSTSSYELYEGERISSSRIRKALGKGDVVSAANMLSRPYALTGDVFKGKGRGVQIGFPTVNLAVSKDKEPIIPLGVYDALVCNERAIVNFGFAPTFSSQAWAEPVIEAHFLGEVPKIPERGVKTEFLRFIRPEKKFSSIDDLKEQILIDKASCLNTPMKR